MFPGNYKKIGSGSGADKGERILDALLTEMDSFGKDDSSSSLQLGKNNINVPPSVTILVLSVTNPPSILDPSLLRPVVNDAVLLIVKEWREMTNVDNNKRMES